MHLPQLLFVSAYVVLITFLGRTTPPKFNIAPAKMMVGRRSFPFGMVYFQRRTVKLQVGTSIRPVGGGFKYFLFSSLLGEDSHFD